MDYKRIEENFAKLDRKKDEFDKLFLEKNKDIDKLIEEEWKELIFDEEIKEMFYPEVLEINNYKIDNKRLHLFHLNGFYSYFIIEEILEDEYFNNKQEAFRFNYKEKHIIYKHRYLELENIDPYLETQDLLADNKAKFKYLEEKIEFLNWSKKYKKEIKQLIKNYLNSGEDKDSFFNNEYNIEKYIENIERDIEKLNQIEIG